MSRIPISYATSLFGILIALAAWLGGPPVQMVLAPMGGIALAWRSRW
jgi:hypothetical protein